MAGDDAYTFGLSDWRSTTLEEVVDAVWEVSGARLLDEVAEGKPGYIDATATMRGIASHGEHLAPFLRAGAGRVLLATGHPTGLLGHYASIARALREAGCEILHPLDDHHLSPSPAGPRRIRFVAGVACVTDGPDLLHTHVCTYMEAILDALGGGPDAVDLVIGDHGMAGAAIERGILTLSIADINDPALPLAQARGRTETVLMIDDNLTPRLYEPMTLAMLESPMKGVGCGDDANP